ncbi:MAG: ATP-dependent ligase [Aeromicrobium sp.]|jgi:ATP-dependent DNA ligase|nr:ATP-dependent ligase [Aeromicrobium sp.]
MLPFPQEPALARSATELPDTEAMPGGAVYEPKFDGYRALLFVHGGECRIQSRAGRDVTHAFPDIAAAAIQSLPSGVVVDGEIVLWGDEVDDFVELDRRLNHAAPASVRERHPASFIAFDLLSGAGMDMRRSPFRVRRHALTMLLGDEPAPLHLVPQTPDLGEAQAWLATYAGANVGIEGVVAKGLATAYEPDGHPWLKVRTHDSTECVIGAVAGSLRAPRRLILGLLDGDGLLGPVGCTVELTLPQSRRMASLLLPAESSHPWTLPDAIVDSPGWTGPATDGVLVVPTHVVEVSVQAGEDPASWTTPRELIRSRPDLRPDDLQARWIHA